MAGLSLLDGASRQAAGAFLARMVRLEPTALVRLRPARGGGPPDAVELWGRLPFGVLVTRSVLATAEADATVPAGQLLAAIAAAADPGPWVVDLPRRRDRDWRWSLPPERSTEVERLLAADVRRVSAAAATTIATIGAEGLAGRPVADRALRDAVLDHVPFLVTPDAAAAAGDAAPPAPVGVSQRLVQAIMRMGFVAGDDDGTVGVRTAGRWVGLVARYGSVWHNAGQV
jgi:hypothetical protein